MEWLMPDDVSVGAAAGWSCRRRHELVAAAFLRLSCRSPAPSLAGVGMTPPAVKFTPSRRLPLAHLKSAPPSAHAASPAPSRRSSQLAIKLTSCVAVRQRGIRQRLDDGGSEFRLASQRQTTSSASRSWATRASRSAPSGWLSVLGASLVASRGRPHRFRDACGDVVTAGALRRTNYLRVYSAAYAVWAIWVLMHCLSPFLSDFRLLPSHFRPFCIV